ncbi:ferric reductase-like transmembrane domain-containing protein [Brevibacillus daliensis]|uniref:ferric reductase-like transmembrane domain-containing protein n=1 Tax=Brevibacillus daliensis TaxID=2892995 RepID=UPI001E49AACA|nr:ferric reductase-like transmembrane domain-containing protein [Brevibacillus daliensis]
MSIELFSIWNFIRLSGFLAFFLFTFSISAGLLSRFAIFQKKKLLMLELHQTSGWAGFLTSIFHVILLWKNEYVPYKIQEILIPFLAENATVFSALGTISLYLFVITFATSDFFIKKLGRDLWKKVHLIVIPAWILMVLHSILIGTDSEQPWASFLYGASIILVITLIQFRYLEGRRNPLNKKGPRTNT